MGKGLEVVRRTLERDESGTVKDDRTQPMVLEGYERKPPTRFAIVIWTDCLIDHRRGRAVETINLRVVMEG